MDGTYKIVLELPSSCHYAAFSVPKAFVRRHAERGYATSAEVRIKVPPHLCDDGDLMALRGAWEGYWSINPDITPDHAQLLAERVWANEDKIRADLVLAGVKANLTRVKAMTREVLVGIEDDLAEAESRTTWAHDKIRSVMDELDIPDVEARDDTAAAKGTEE